MTTLTARPICRAVTLAAALAAASTYGRGSETERPAAVARAAIELNDWPTVQGAATEIVDPNWRRLFAAGLAASRLDEPGTQRILEPLLAPGVLTQEQRLFALSTLAEVQFAQGNYGAAERTAREWSAHLVEAGRTGELAGVEQFLFVADALAAAPPQEVVALTPGREITTRDKVGLVRATIDVNDGEVEAVLDTGANLSVVSRSVAERLGLIMLGAKGAVGSATTTAVGAQIGIAEQLTIAGAELKNVAFLVMDDAALTLPVPGGYRIDAIIGFPVFKALGRIDFSREGTFAWAPSGGGAGEQNLFADGNDLYLKAGVGTTTVSLHLDTGATVSDLTGAFARRAPALVESRRTSVTRARNRASAGGTVSSSTVSLALVPVRLGDVLMCLPSIDLALGDDETGPKKLGTIGQDVLSRFASYSIDFVSMRFEAEPLSDQRIASDTSASEKEVVDRAPAIEGC